MDECSELPDDQLLCNHYCHNYIGGFYCSCRYGYLLDSDNKTCKGEATWLLATWPASTARNWHLWLLSGVMKCSDVLWYVDIMAQCGSGLLSFRVSLSSQWLSISNCSGDVMSDCPALLFLDLMLCSVAILADLFYFWGGKLDCCLLYQVKKQN